MFFQMGFHALQDRETPVRTDMPEPRGNELKVIAGRHGPDALRLLRVSAVELLRRPEPQVQAVHILDEGEQVAAIHIPGEETPNIGREVELAVAVGPRPSPAAHHGALGARAAGDIPDHHGAGPVLDITALFDEEDIEGPPGPRELEGRKDSRGPRAHDYHVIGLHVSGTR
jgi:hypothetical protein